MTGKHSISGHSSSDDYIRLVQVHKPHIGKHFTLSEWAGGPGDSHINSIQQLKDQLLSFLLQTLTSVQHHPLFVTKTPNVKTPLTLITVRAILVIQDMEKRVKVREKL